jgi:hypothetical protein
MCLNPKIHQHARVVGIGVSVTSSQMTNPTPTVLMTPSIEYDAKLVSCDW